MSVRTEYHYDELEDRLIINRVQDVEPILDHLQRVRGVTDGRGKDMYFAGQIPAVVVEQYLKKHGVGFDEFLSNPAHVRRLLNDPDFAKLRVWGGKL